MPNPNPSPNPNPNPNRDPDRNPDPNPNQVLRGALVRVTARAVRDPLALELWGGAMEGAESVRGAARLRRAAASGALRAHAEAVAGNSEGEETRWLTNPSPNPNPKPKPDP